MSQRTKENLKRAGVAAIGTIAIGGLFALVGSILLILNGKVDSTQAQVNNQATIIESVKTDTRWIRTYLCSKDKSSNCPIPIN